MENKCSECFKRCRGECCIFAPLPISLLEGNKDKFQRPVLGMIKRNAISCYPIVEIEENNSVDKQKQICPFKDSNNQCVIYDQRPELCKMFGTSLKEDHPLTCHYHIGKDYSFPAEGTIEYSKINNEKYFGEILSNSKLIKEMF